MVGSFSVFRKSKKDFYLSLKNFCNNFNNDKVEICYQLLPPFAWYFGGSVKVNIFDSMEDYQLISELDIPICIDLSHLIMSANFYKFDSERAFNLLEKNAIHFHISGADGSDGEGKGLYSLNNSENIILRKMLKSSQKCVVEIWQGHLNNFKGFKQELNYLNSLSF